MRYEYMRTEQSLITSEIFDSKIKLDWGSELFEERISMHLDLDMFTAVSRHAFIGKYMMYAVQISVVGCELAPSME